MSSGICWEQQHPAQGKPPSPAEIFLQAARKGQKEEKTQTTSPPKISPVLLITQQSVPLALNITYIKAWPEVTGLLILEI